MKHIPNLSDSRWHPRPDVLRQILETESCIAHCGRRDEKVAIRQRLRKPRALIILKFKMNYLTGVRLHRFARHPFNHSRCALIALATALILVNHPIPALHAEDAPGNALLNPQAIVFNAATKKAYVVDRAHSAVYIIHAGTQEHHRVPVGAGPISIGVNTRTGRAYVVNADDGTVSVIDGDADTVVATVAIGSHPYSIAVNSVTGLAYISHTYSDQTTILDCATNAVSNLRTGSSDLVAIDPDRNIIYLMGYESATLAVLDGASRSLSSISIGMHEWGLALEEGAGTVFVARTGAAEVAVLKRSSSVPASIPTGNIPCALAFNRKRQRAYVANYGDNSVTVIDTRTGRAIATVPAGNRPQAIAFDAVRNLVLVANTHDDIVTVLDGSTYAQLGKLPAGKHPYALALDSASGNLYVADLDDAWPFTIILLRGIRKA
jgi:YVTN family beta-propeller protein